MTGIRRVVGMDTYVEDGIPARVLYRTAQASSYVSI